MPRPGRNPFAGVLLAIPNLGTIHTELALLLPALVGAGATVYAPNGIKPTARARNACVDRFLAGTWSHLWFVDADTVPPPTALGLLLEATVPAISGCVPTLKRGDDGRLVREFIVAKFAPDGELRCYQGRGVERIDRAGSACMLLERAVYLKLARPWYEDRIAASSGRQPTGQDFVFCERLAEAAVPLYAHFDVRCRHRKDVDL